ncbi:hypothetical protein I7I51_03726, partial [Histoplasma capsulatum]
GNLGTKRRLTSEATLRSISSQRQFMEKRGNIGQNNADNRKSTVKVCGSEKVVLISLRNSKIPETCLGNKNGSKAAQLKTCRFPSIAFIKARILCPLNRTTSDLLLSSWRKKGKKKKKKKNHSPALRISRWWGGRMSMVLYSVSLIKIW